MNRVYFKRIVKVALTFLILLALFPAGSQAETVCAQVKIEIKQELTLERQAFDAMMRISNGLDTLPINNVNVAVNFTDEAGNSVLASSDPNNTLAEFFIRIDTMDNIADVSGYGSVAPATTAEIHWLIIPAPGAAENNPTGKLYFVGATLDYTLGGEPESVTVTPDFITVKPLPNLTLDYFLTREVNADDPLTPAIEPIEPYTLGVRVQNNGIADAKNLKIESAQPKIIENEQGLLIGFEIIGSTVDDQPSAPTLLVDFGTIGGNSSRVGRWDMISTLSGEFVEFSATFTHADELGGALTSILDATNAHLLVRDVRVDLPGRDNVRDFLAADGDVLRVYESDSIDTAVTDHSSQATFSLHNQSGTVMTYDLSFPATNGFAYVKLPDPHGGQKTIHRVVRSDGKLIPLDNAWTSKTRNRNTNPMSWDHYINFFDTSTTGIYSVQMDDLVTGPVAPIIQYIPSRATYVGNQVGFIIEASDPNGEIPALSAAPLPIDAVFTDNGNGTAFFNWTPSNGQTGIYTITYTATDGALSSTRSATIRVNSANDTDGDGMDDAWELEHFGNLDRDGSGDFDGDGISDLDEFLNGTDPSVGPQVPVIHSPSYDTEVNQLQPVLTIVNNTHPVDITTTYSFELYADAEMTQLVSQADNVAEGVDFTSWQVPVVLNDNTGYTWRVRAFDGTVYSLWGHGRFFVNTINDPPGVFTISTPLDGAEVDRVNPLVAVTNAMDVDRDALSYRFEISELVDFSTIFTSVEGINPGLGGSTGWVVDVALTENSYYYWRATVVDEHGLESVGPIAGFFVNTANDAPLAPVVLSPPDGGIVTETSTTLVVENGIDPEGDSLSYLFELDNVDTFDSIDKQASVAIPEQNVTTQWAVTGLEENTTYYWRAKASDGIVDSDWVVASFTVNAANTPPPTPSVRNPGDGAWVATLQPTLSVNPSIDPDGDPVNYHFELYSDVDLTGLVAQSITTETDWIVPTPLINNTWYFWRVRAEDNANGLSEWSAVTRFFVDDNGVNDTPTLSFLEPAADIEVTTGATTLRWSDDDPDSSATIALYYDNDQLGADGTLIIDNIAEDSDEADDAYSWMVAMLPPGDYWVYAVIDDGNSTTTVYNPNTITVRLTEIVLDNSDANVIVRGDWPLSTSVSGYLGANYQYHEANGPSPEAITLDNSNLTVFSTLGNWTNSTAVNGYVGDNYQYHAANGDPVDGFVIDNGDSGFTTLGDWPLSTSVGGYEGADYQHHAANGVPPTGQIADNSDPTVMSLGAWNNSTSTSGYYLSDYQYHSAGSGANSFTWFPAIETTGRHLVYARWTSHSNRASNAPYTITHDGGTDTVRVNQQQQGGEWNLLGSYDFTQGVQYGVALTDDADGYVIADAILVVPEDAAANQAHWAFDISETDQYQVFAKWTAHSNRASNATYVVTDALTETSVVVDQRVNGGNWNLLGTFTFNQGSSYQVSLSDQADGYVIADAIKVVPLNARPNSAIWSFSVPQPGSYRVFANWTSHPNRASDAKFTISSDLGDTTVPVNQRLNGGDWNLLGTYNFTDGIDYQVTLTDQADGYVIADAIQVSPIDAAPNQFSWNTSVPQSGQYEVYARWTAHPNRATNATYTIQSDDGVNTVTVNQQTDGVRWNLLGIYSFTQGSDYQMTLTDEADGYVIADGIKLVPVIP
ncbi:MAG: Ig-like domain-containing protein [Candidatus Thiodiazotropha lotti]|nr:Ig-like domain-containing protein [Candidatus Thiodiazotropha lotti]